MRIFVVLSSIVLLVHQSAFCEAPASCWAGLEENELKQFEQILGAPRTEWEHRRFNGTAMTPKLTTADSIPVVAGQGPYYQWLPKHPLKVGDELTVTLRLGGDPALTRNANVYVGIGADEEIGRSGAGYAATLSVRGGRDSAGCSVYPTKDRRNYLGRGGYGPWLSNRSLGWPESLRKRVEHDMAAVTPLHEKWLTMTWQIMENGARFYLDGNLIWDGANSGRKLSGRVAMVLGVGVELRRIAKRRFERPSGRFEQIGLGAFANAAPAIVTPTNSKKDGQLTVGEVPFSLTGADQDGHDHIDIGKNWVKFASYGSRESPRNGQLGGRWKGLATLVDPSRSMIAIPGGRYRAIHLLAASDSETDSVPIITAQFFRPEAGRPVNFETRVPLFTAKGTAGKSMPVKLTDGTMGSLHLVTIPIDPGQLATFSDLGVIGLELTKEVQLYRIAPDPMFYSYHPAGLKSSVHLYGLALERPMVMMTVESNRYADIWTAPETPAYKIQLQNTDAAPRDAEVTWVATAHAGRDIQRGEIELTIPPGKAGAALDVNINVKRYGYHELIIRMTSGDEVWTERRTITWLREDTRTRGNWQRGQGPIFGFWNWRGGHYTPPADRQTYVMGLAGAESSSGSFVGRRGSEEEQAVAREFKMATFKTFGAGDHYTTARFASSLQKEGIEKAREAFVARLKETEGKASDIHRPLFLSFFPEPHIGHHTSGTPGSYYGEPEANEFQFSEAEQARFDLWTNGFIEGARIVKEYFPHVKCMMPHGDPTFPAPFLRRSEEVRKLIDGVTVDIPAFERLPEQQLHQVSLHRMYICLQEFRKAGIKDPWLPMYEGPCLPTRPGSLTPQEHADLSIRNSLILLAYGVDMQLGGLSPFDAGSYWGEQHYGGGMMEALPTIRARPTYAAFATMTRHLNRRNFKRWLPTGSLSVYCLEFQHYKSGERVHVLWTLRGERPVSVDSAAKSIQVHDANDNLQPTKTEQAGTTTFTIGKSPCFVHGLPKDVHITLGQPDHGDSNPGTNTRKIASLGDGTWKHSTERDKHYEESHENFVKRFPGDMRTSLVSGTEQAGAKVISVQLNKPIRERKTMPFYSSLIPATPILIPGKASQLGLWVQGSSDWGRVVYCLRDSEGERWISVGTSGSWNCDDLHSWSAFCFDGWRYLPFELPANSPWDGFREKGFAWWGSYGGGGGEIDLPLKLEKIIVERRTHALYANDIQPTSGQPVLLGDLYAEYAKPSDASEETVRLSRLRMPVPDGLPSMSNPISELAKNGALDGPVVSKITLPEQQADGTRCYVHFTTMDDAVHYDVWASPYKSGMGALKLGKAWKESGGLIRGLRSDTEFYLFVTSTNAAKETSKPSTGFRIVLKDVFGMK